MATEITLPDAEEILRRMDLCRAELAELLHPAFVKTSFEAQWDASIHDERG
jgi:hypothetical protein